MKKLIFFLIVLNFMSLKAQWVDVGPATGFAPAGAVVPQLRFHPVTSEPHILFLDFEQNVGAGYTLMRFDGSNWTDVGGRYFQPEVFGILTPFQVGFEFNPINNRPTVQYNSPPLHVQEYDGVSWVEFVGTNTITIRDFFAGGGLSFALNPLTGYPTVAFSDSSPGGVLGLASVVSFGGTNWGYLGTPKFTQTTTVYLDIAYSILNGAPYLLHGGGPANQITVSAFDGAIWNDLGSPNFANQNNTIAKIRINQITGDIYIAKPSTINTQPTIEVKKWDGTNWVELVTDITQVHSQATAFDIQIHPISGEVFLLYMDRDLGGANPQLNLKQLIGSDWLQVGTESISTGGSDHISLEFHPTTNIPYVAYGSASGSGGWLKKFNGVLEVNDTNVLEASVLYPNPAGDTVSFSDVTVNEIIVYDQNGRQLLSAKNNSVNLEFLAPGLYYIKGSNGDATVVKKLIKK